jgi:hypothetical protein
MEPTIVRLCKELPEIQVTAKTTTNWEAQMARHINLSVQLSCVWSRTTSHFKKKNSGPLPFANTCTSPDIHLSSSNSLSSSDRQLPQIEHWTSRLPLV